jgi:1-acyl-sn-glycerol-3-phosphate acyltransferase
LNLKLAYRLTRVVLHLIKGLTISALVFPLLGYQRRNRHIQRWSGQLLRICGIAVEIAPGAPALEHAMIVANHVSWLDIFVINTVFPSRFVAKAEIRDWPILGWLADQAGTVFIARGKRRDLRHIFKGLVHKLEAGERVALFPEGTTASQGQLLPFHANLFEAAIDAHVPVQPYALRYVDAGGRLHPNVDFIGEMSFAESMLKILSGSAIHAKVECLAPLDTAGAHRRELAEAAHAAVLARLKQA